MAYVETNLQDHLLTARSESCCILLVLHSSIERIWQARNEFYLHLNFVVHRGCIRPFEEGVTGCVGGDVM